MDNRWLWQQIFHDLLRNWFGESDGFLFVCRQGGEMMVAKELVGSGYDSGLLTSVRNGSCSGMRSYGSGLSTLVGEERVRRLFCGRL